MKKYKEKILNWAQRNVHRPQAAWVLGLVAFAESSFFPIPADVLLIPLVLLNKKKWLYFGLVATVASVLGGVVGYLIGWLLFDTIGQWLVETYNVAQQLQIVQTWYADNTFVTTFIAAFTFIPYKVFTIAGGLFKAPIIPFVVASTLGRGIRFLGEAYFMYKFGERIGKTIYKYFSLVVFVVVILVVVLLLI